jgi:hypothetical protein
MNPVSKKQSPPRRKGFRRLVDPVLIGKSIDTSADDEIAIAGFAMKIRER